MKNIRVFLSSTFRDTHVERDALTRMIFPALKDWCEKRNLRITEVDLRWGVTQEESSAGKAVQICLDEIDRSDIFLCLIGSRYGYVPDSYNLGEEERFKWTNDVGSGLSITELEIMRGALNDKENRAKRVSSALFYFRDEKFLENLAGRPKELCEFTDGRAEYEDGQLQYIPDTVKEEKLLNLKSRIVEQSKRQQTDDVKIKVTENYSSLYSETEGLSNMNEAVLRDFVSMVVEDLKQVIREKYPMDPPEKLTKSDPNTRAQQAQDKYIENKVESFQGRQELVEKVKKYAFAQVVGGPLMLAGEAGMGKTSVLCRAVQDLRSEAKMKNVQVKKLQARAKLSSRNGGGRASASALKPFVVISYFAGANPGSLLIVNMLRNLLFQVRKHLKLLRPRKRADELWALLRATIKLGGSTLAGKLEEKDIKQPSVAKHRQHKAVGYEMPSNYIDVVEDFKRSLVELCGLAKVVLVVDNLEHLVADKNKAVMLRWLPSDLPLTLRLIAGVDLDPNRSLNDTGRDGSLMSRLPRSTKSLRRPTSPASDPGVSSSEQSPVMRERVMSAKGGRSSRGGSVLLGPTERIERQTFLESFQIQYSDTEVIEVPGLSEALAKQIIRSQLAVYGKRLLDTQLSILADKGGSKNPTWILVACEELRVFSKYDYLEYCILDLADDLSGLFEQMIKRLERDHGPAFVRDTLSVIVCSRDGLFEKDVVGILGVPMSAWSLLYYSIKPLLSKTSQDGDGLISFTHRNFTMAILKRYFADEGATYEDLAKPQQITALQQESGAAIPIHGRLASYFKEDSFDQRSETWGEDGRSLSSLTYHLVYGKMYKTLEKTLTDLQFIEALLAAGCGFSWIDDLSNALYLFERIRAAQAVIPVGPGLGLDLEAFSPKSPGSPQVASRMIQHSHVSSFKPRPKTEGSVDGAESHKGYLADTTGARGEGVVTEEMLNRIYDYYAFAQKFMPELNANPYLVFQYASNLPDSNSAAISAKRHWGKANQHAKRRAYLRWVNKPQEAGPCLLTLSGHAAPVLHCDISRDEIKVATASADRTVRVWISQTGECHMILDKHTDAVTCVCFSPVSNEVIVSASRDGTARVWLREMPSRIFEGHEGAAILSCAISECGSYVATGDQNGRLIIWEIFAEGPPLHDFSFFKGGVTKVKFSANGEYIFASGFDNTIRGWNLVTGQQYMCKSGQALGMTSAAVGDQEKLHYCVRTSAMGLRIFDAAYTNKELSTASHINPCGLVENANASNYFPELESTMEKDSALAADQEADDTFEEKEDWEINAASENANWEPQPPTFDRSSTITDPNLPVRDLREIPRCSLRDSKPHLVTCSSLSRDNRVALGKEDSSIEVYKATTGECVCALHGHIGKVNHVEYSISGQLLVSAGDDHTVRIWNPRRARLRNKRPHKAKLTNCSFNQSNRILSLLSISQEGQLTLWNAGNGYRTSLQPQEDMIRDAKFSRDGKSYVTVSSVVRILSTTTDGKTCVIPQGNVGCWDMSPCGKLFVACEVGGKDVSVWTLDSNPIKRVRILGSAHEKKITLIQFSQDGALLYTAANDGKIRAWDSVKIAQQVLVQRNKLLASSGLKAQKMAERGEGPRCSTKDALKQQEQSGAGAVEPLLELFDPKDMGMASLISQIHESPCGRFLLCTSDSSDIKFWDIDAYLIPQGKSMEDDEYTGISVHGHSTRVLCAAWSPHGQQFASGCNTGTIRLWDRSTLFCSTIINGHTSAVTDLQYMPDGRRVVSISNDKCVTIWSSANGDCVNSMIFDAPLTCLTISSTGRFLAAGDVKGDMRILETMNPFLGMDQESADKTNDKEADETNARGSNEFEYEEFPFVVPFKILSPTKKTKKWSQRCQFTCPHCAETLAVDGNTMKQVLKAEKDAETQGGIFNKEDFYDLRMLKRCVSCRKVSRMAPFRLDRSALLSRFQWNGSATNRKRTPKTITKTETWLLRNAAITQFEESDAFRFYDPLTSEKMAPFRRKTSVLPQLELHTSKKDSGEGKGSSHDILGRHLHALALKSKSKKRYRTFSRRETKDASKKSAETNFVSMIRSTHLKNKRANKLIPDSSLVTRSMAPSWLSVFDQASRPGTSQTFTDEKGEPGQEVEQQGTIVMCDEKSLAREGHLLRRCHTASNGAIRRKAGGPRIPKVVRSTTDLLDPENMYRVVHGKNSNFSQLEAVRQANPYALQITPDFIDFGTLCEHSIYRYPVKLVNTNPTLLRFRVAVEFAQARPEEYDSDDGRPAKSKVNEDGERRGLQDSFNKTKAKPTFSHCALTTMEDNQMKAVVPSGSKKVFHGLQSIIYVEIHCAKPGIMNGMLRISTDKCHLFSTPIKANIASKADFASSLKRARTEGKKGLTNKDVIHIRTALKNFDL